MTTKGHITMFDESALRPAPGAKPTVVSSVIYEVADKVGVNTTKPRATIDVVGDAAIIDPNISYTPDPTEPHPRLLAYARDGVAIRAIATGLYTVGVYGSGVESGVVGHATDENGNGVYGISSTNGCGGRFWAPGIGASALVAYAPTGGIAAHLDGEVHAGDLFASSVSAGSKSFVIDHPLDPANKYLRHSSVESSEMKNIYDGMATLDSKGEALVNLPDWFEAENVDFRYQLTAVGGAFTPYIAAEIAKNSFKIAGGMPGKKVSWQVTGVRQDAFAKAHPIHVEEQKPEIERGFYLHPELFNAEPEKQVEWARRPKLMKNIKEMPHPIHPPRKIKPA